MLGVYMMFGRSQKYFSKAGSQRSAQKHQQKTLCSAEGTVAAASRGRLASIKKGAKRGKKQHISEIELSAALKSSKTEQRLTKREGKSGLTRQRHRAGTC